MPADEVISNNINSRINMNLQLEVLDQVEAPVTTSEAVLIGIAALETGILIGLAIT